MFVVVNHDTGKHTLYTALGTTPNIDESFSNELAFCGVPRYDLPGSAADSVALLHYAHRKAFLDAIPAGGAKPQPFNFTGTATPQ